MKRFVPTMIGTTLAAVIWGIATRGDVAFGGEMLLPLLVVVYAIATYTEEDDEEEPRT